MRENTNHRSSEGTFLISTPEGRQPAHPTDRGLGMAESPAFRTGYMSLLLPSSTGDLEVRSSIRNMVIDALAATGEWPMRVDVVTSTGSDDGQTKRWFVEYRPGPAARA